MTSYERMMRLEAKEEMHTMKKYKLKASIPSGTYEVFVDTVMSLEDLRKHLEGEIGMKVLELEIVKTEDEVIE